MISICIPIYDNDVTTLVNDLHNQCTDSLVEFEILLLDDVSLDMGIGEKNEKLAQLDNVYYSVNSQKLGLARTKNKLGKLAKYPYLLFVDGDMHLFVRDYIVRYLKLCQPNVVSFGGCMYENNCDQREYILAWKYGKKREEGIGKYYSCRNFLIDKNIFLKYPFFESAHLSEYEEILFGMLLKNNNIDILFVDNPLSRIVCTTSSDFISDFEESLSDLLKIEGYLKSQGIETGIQLLSKSEQLEQRGMQSLVINIWNKLRNICLNNLTSNNPSLIIFDFYKLGYFCNLKKQKRNADS